MSDHKKKKVLHVDNLVIHAKNVEIIHERKKDDYPRRDPWGFFWGKRPKRDVLRDDIEMDDRFGKNDD
ncbi:hypothetical protein [Bacillus sp. Marseille-P3661]|uniref:hypothetical protein n=1 Tax=Bacillus sp. Marseille-P3661 TaxID=1936234 RepID=UPI000C846080|nr:hypothetical protein [Bacillus sp. Marseille-P3661]